MGKHYSQTRTWPAVNTVDIFPKQSVALPVILTKKLTPFCQSALQSLFYWGAYAFYGLSRVNFQSQLAFPTPPTLSP